MQPPCTSFTLRSNAHQFGNRFAVARDQDFVLDLDIQHGKFDRGRRKMPWLERNDSRISLTITRAGGLNFEASLPEHITPHPYRVGAADALISASSSAAGHER
jgi:hypothetical protein